MRVRGDIVTQELIDKVKALADRYPGMANKDIAAILIGNGDIRNMSEYTISRMKNCKDFDEYVSRQRESKARYKASRQEPEQDHGQPERDHEQQEYDVPELIELVRQQNDTLQTIALLLNATLNLWHGTTKSVEDNIAQEISEAG